MLGGGLLIQHAFATTVFETFTYTGADQSFVVPGGVTEIDVWLWGAGGGYKGGAGGFASGAIPVTPGDTLTLVVGGGGGTTSGISAFGGGGSFSNAGAGGAGGGRSGIDLLGTQLIVAGGGGGGTGTSGAVGGGGGGLTGSDGTAIVGGTQGTGGTQNAGGTSGGGLLTGGVGFRGGGGGGYYGGGGGGVFSATLGGGGGGSSFWAVFVLGGSTLSGTNGAEAGVAAPNSVDSHYLSGVGVGGATGAAGGNGLIVIGYEVADVPEPATFATAVVGVVLMGVIRRSKVSPAPWTRAGSTKSPSEMKSP